MTPNPIIGTMKEGGVLLNVRRCSTCRGTGEVAVYRQETVVCPECKGRGSDRWDSSEACNWCNGDGDILDTVAERDYCGFCGGAGEFCTEVPFAWLRRELGSVLLRGMP